MLNRLVPIVAAFLLGACTTVPSVSGTAAPSQSRFAGGMVSAADPRAAEAGAEILRKGGSATDAAIATMLALTVVEPQSSGIGGGGFYLRAGADDSLESLDGRERAPLAAGPDWFIGEDGKPFDHRNAVTTGISIGVPGNIALAAKAHERHGRLAWRELFEPAIRLARDGWVLTERGRRYLEIRPMTASRDALGSVLFFDANGEPLPVGTRITNEDLAKTFERIANEGPESFYRGAHAEQMVAKIARDTHRERSMAVSDLETYEAKWRRAVCGLYRLHRICGMGPPSSGATTVLAILGQLERFDLAALDPQSPMFWHLFAESQRLAYADRERFLADPDFIAVPVLELIDPTYLAKRGARISVNTTQETVEPGLVQPPPDGMEPPEQGTSHFVAIDSEGNAVTYTSTIEGPFGSGLMYGGFYLNNELTDFSFIPEEDGRSVANRVEGGKRPRSSMSPTLVYGPDDKLVLAIGAAGGGTIPVQVARALIGFIDWGLPIDEALALPVLYSPADTMILEKGTELEALAPALEALGHKQVIVRELPIKTNAIAVVGGQLSGAADPRSEGSAVGE